MRVVPVGPSLRSSFIAYALAHGPEHDNSYTGAEDLAAFDPLVEPAVLLYDRAGHVAGAASLLTSGYGEEGQARFRILHSLCAQGYASLLSRILASVPPSVRQVFLFLKEESRSSALLPGLGFRETRRAAVLRRSLREPVGSAAAEKGPPQGVEVRPVDPGREAGAWAEVLNAAFAGYPGRSDVGEEKALSLLEADRVLPRGALLAWEGERAVAAVVVSSEADSCGQPIATVDTLAVIPAMQGKGLGRALLQLGLTAARHAGLDVVEISTGSANQRALSLYEEEGFIVVDTAVCWTRVL